MSERYERRQERDTRIGRLLNREAYDKDPQYHYEVAMLRNWINVTEMAMEDEHVPPDVIERVLNRLIYATPHGAESHDRIERQRLEIDKINHAMRGVRCGHGFPSDVCIRCHPELLGTQR